MYSLSVIRVQTTMNHISIFTFLLVFTTISTSKKCFLAERELKKALRDTLTRAAWLGPVIFDWFVLSMRMQVIPGSLDPWTLLSPSRVQPRERLEGSRSCERFFVDILLEQADLYSLVFFLDI